MFIRLLILTIVIIILLVLFFTIPYYLINYVFEFDETNKAIVTFTLYPALIIIGGIIYAVYNDIIDDRFNKNIVDAITDWVAKDNSTIRYSLFLFGFGGSGKSSFINYLNRQYRLGMPSTLYPIKNRFIYNLENNRKANFYTYDYKGQHMEQVLFGEEKIRVKYRRVRAIIILVDLFPVYTRKEEGIENTLSGDEYLNALFKQSEDSKQTIDDIITERTIAQTRQYYNALSLVFRQIYNKNRKQVRIVKLFINKMDLVNSVLIKDPNSLMEIAQNFSGDTNLYAKSKYLELINMISEELRIRKAEHLFNISRDVHCVSMLGNNELTRVVSDITEICTRDGEG